MGTNYYWHSSAKCPTCGRDAEEELHIGKSSAGWVFALRTYSEDERKPQSLPDWCERFMRQGSFIMDEYSKRCDPANMLATILLRKAASPDNESASWYHQNQAVPGPNGLARARIDGHHVIAHGDGTYDLHDSEFS